MTAHVAPPPASSVVDDALAWLEGRLGPAQEEGGARVLLATYGNVAYFGILDRNFVTRYERQGTQLIVSPLNCPLPAPETRAWTHAADGAIRSLLSAGRIASIRPPAQYEGAAVLYALAH